MHRFGGRRKGTVNQFDAIMPRTAEGAADDVKERAQGLLADLIRQLDRSR